MSDFLFPSVFLGIGGRNNASIAALLAPGPGVGSFLELPAVGSESLLELFYKRILTYHVNFQLL